MGPAHFPGTGLCTEGVGPVWGSSPTFYCLLQGVSGSTVEGLAASPLDAAHTSQPFRNHPGILAERLVWTRQYARFWGCRARDDVIVDCLWARDAQRDG